MNSGRENGDEYNDGRRNAWAYPARAGPAFRGTWRKVDFGKVVGEIVEAWLADRERAALLARAQGTGDDDIPRGYHWKELFLPEGTLLRLYIFGPDERAVVVGDRLMYRGEPVSPNGFVRLFKHVPCNAWENLAVLFPGERNWIRAKYLRRGKAGPRDRRGQAKPRRPAMMPPP